MRAFVVLCVCSSLLLSACQDEPALRVLPALGNLHGHACDPESGRLVAGATVTIDAVNHRHNGVFFRTHTTVSDQTGYWELFDVAEGAQTIRYTKEIVDFSLELEVTVVPQQRNSIELSECVVPLGTIAGRICDTALGEWLTQARVYVDVGDQIIETTTDQEGRFVLVDVPQGTRTVVVRKGAYVKTYEDVQVFGNSTVTIGEQVCLQGPCGDLRGRVCAIEDGDAGGYWLAAARVYIQVGSGTVETLSDSQGWFTLTCIPPGRYTVHAERGSFSMQFEADVLAEELNVLPEPMCIQPENVRLAVVTGMFDSVEEILYSLGFLAREACDAINAPPACRQLDSTGSVTTYDGRNTDFYITDFLRDLELMRRYDVIFFNCGLWDIHFAGDPLAIANLQQYVELGGSIYVSDYAYELLRVAFPGYLDWVGSEDIPGDAKRGEQNPDQQATVVDFQLAAALGDVTPGDGMPVTLNFDKSGWVVLESRATQEALDTKVWVVADVSHSAGTDVHDSALMASFPVGDGGRVVFTSFHNHSQVNQTMQRILKYMIFEL